MENKDVKRGKKPSSSASSADPYSGDRREDGRITSASELFERMNQGMAQGRHDAQKELTGSEFLEFLKRQGPEGSRGGRTGGNRNQNTQRYKNQNDQTVAIGQCDITSSVDYGSRDYYCPSAHTSDAPYIHKENERDDLYKTSTDTRGNWWEGSYYY